MHHRESPFPQARYRHEILNFSMADSSIDVGEAENKKSSIENCNQRPNEENKKRRAECVDDEQLASKRPRDDEGRKITISGLKGISQELLQNHMDRAGVPYLKVWKQRKQNTAFVWFADDALILRVH